MHLNLHRLWIFTQVIDCGGFSAAAQKLYMSQPSVSNQVRQLEQSLQVVLVDRSGGRVRPTPEGEVLEQYARRIFALSDEAVAAVQQVRTLEVGQLRVGGSTTIGAHLLPTLMSRYRERFPGVGVEIFVGNLEQVEHALLDGDLGLAVVAGQPAAQQLTSIHVLDERIVLICSVDHPRAGQAVDPAELTGEVFLMREQGSHTRALQEETMADWGLGQARTSEFWGSETIKQSVSVGLGVSLISEHAVLRERQDGSLATIEVAADSPTRAVNLAFRSDRRLAPAEAAFVDLMTKVHNWPNATGRVAVAQPVGRGTDEA